MNTFLRSERGLGSCTRPFCSVRRCPPRTQCCARATNPGESPPAAASLGQRQLQRPRQDAYDKYQSHGWNVQISQPLYDRARWDAWRAEQITARLGDSQLDNTTSELLLDVGKASLETLTARDKLTAVPAEKNAYQLQIRQAKALFQSGEATIIDTYEAQAGYDSARGCLQFV